MHLPLFLQIGGHNQSPVTKHTKPTQTSQTDAATPTGVSDPAISNTTTSPGIAKDK